MIFSHAAHDPLDFVQRELILKATAILIIITILSKSLWFWNCPFTEAFLRMPRIVSGI